MRRIVPFALVFLLTLGLCTLCLSATAHNGLCGCGREYAAKDGNGYMIYDCLGCGRNYTSCTCKTCWCGSTLTRTENNGHSLTLCDGCDLPCEDCVCRDRAYYDAILNLPQGVTSREVPNPQNAAVIAVAAALPFGIFLLVYFAFYQRRTASHTRKAPRLERELDRLEREPDVKKRYEMAKQREEARRNEEFRITDADTKELCLRKNELLAAAAEEELIRETVGENLRTCRNVNSLGLNGTAHSAAELWDPKAKGYPADAAKNWGVLPAQCLVKWETKEPQIALFELITPINGRENNLLRPGSNVTRYCTAVFSKDLTLGRTAELQTEEIRRATLQKILPEGNVDALLALCDWEDEPRKAPSGLPGEATSRRMGEKTRYPGGTKE